MIGSLLVTVLLAGSPLKLNGDNISQIVNELTVEEKAALLVGSGSKAFDGVGYTTLYVKGAAGTTHPIERLGIPAIVLADGPAGVRIDDRPCTKFPIGTSLASTWNPHLVEEVGKAIGNEVLEYGVDVLLAPGINIQRNPLCGRNFEYYSEDPLLAGKIAAGYINGIQSQGVGTSIKHFAANNQELNRLYLDARVSPRALRELYLRNFEIAIKESDPWTVMTSYNYVNGTLAAENYDLATGVLRNDWGYDGLVMTDWAAGLHSDKIVSSGNDMIQPGSDEHYKRLVRSMNDGTLPMATVDTAVARLLRLIVKCPRFKGYEYSNKPNLEHNASVARKAAEEGIVLLKNEAKSLPLVPESKIALFGVTSYEFITGGTGAGNVNGSYVINLKQGLSDAGFGLDKATDEFYNDCLKYERFNTRRINGKFDKWFVDAERPSEALPSRTVLEQAAKEADKAVITIGRIFGEGKDRLYQFSYLLSDAEMRLIKEVSTAFHNEGKKLIVVLDVGGIVDLTAWQDMADAIVMSWLPGCEAGHAIAAVLSGKETPSGRLPMSIPVSYYDDPTAGTMPQILTDKPINYSFYRPAPSGVTKRYDIENVDYVNYREGIYSGYRHYITDKVRTAYPFGFGLSYTEFKYSGMNVEEVGEEYVVKVNVENTGKYSGKEVVQIYVKAPGKDMDKPSRELKGFAKTEVLAPGQSQTVEVRIPKTLLTSYDELRSGWAIEKGTYSFIAAINAEKPVLTKKVRIKEASFSPTGDYLNVKPLFIER